MRARRALRALAANLRAMNEEIAGVRDKAFDRMPADTALQDSSLRSASQVAARLKAHLTLSSPVMRHAVRLSLSLLAGFALMSATGDSYGFWILLTIVFVCQPQYAATVVRLVERVVV